MYELSDKKSTTKEIQKFLYFISDKLNPDIPRVAVDGIYGFETAEAVTAFQIIYGLEPTGRTDRKTFDLLYDLYVKNKTSYDVRHIGDDLFPVKFGDQGNHILHIHILMIDLKKRYQDIGLVMKTSYFSRESENAAKELQKIFRMPETGIVDLILYDRMVLELDSLKRLENI